MDIYRTLSCRALMVVATILAMQVLAVPPLSAAQEPAPGTSAVTPNAPTEALMEQDTLFWQSIRESSNPEDFEAYLSQFPAGTFRVLAQTRLAALRNATSNPPSRDTSPPSTSSADPDVLSVFLFHFESDDAQEFIRACPQVQITLDLSNAHALLFDHKFSWGVRASNGQFIGAIRDRGGERTKFSCDAIIASRELLLQLAVDEVSPPADVSRVVFLGLMGGIDGNGLQGGVTNDERADLIRDCPRARVSQDLRSAHIFAVNTLAIMGWTGSHVTTIYNRQGDVEHNIATNRRRTMFRELCEFVAN